MATEETNRPNQSSVGVHISARVRTQTNSYAPSLAGNHYAHAASQISEQEVLHPYTHVLFNHGAVHNEPDITAVIMTHI